MPDETHVEDGRWTGSADVQALRSPVTCKNSIVVSSSGRRTTLLYSIDKVWCGEDIKVVGIYYNYKPKSLEHGNVSFFLSNLYSYLVIIHLSPPRQSSISSIHSLSPPS